MSPTRFKDHFSDRSTDYSQYRPTYPYTLFNWLASQTSGHDLAWDCGTGSGQSAVALAEHYKYVHASDASAEQVANARRHSEVHYSVEPAEHSSLADNSVDLVTVAQALHWFDIEAFADETRRVLKPSGLLAVWCYKLHRISPQLDAVIDELYGETLEDYWPPERRFVSEAYASFQFPMDELITPAFEMTARWRLDQSINYMRTWSAAKRYEAHNGSNPINLFENRLADAWGDPSRVREIRWPLAVRAWRR